MVETRNMFKEFINSLTTNENLKRKLSFIKDITDDYALFNKFCNRVNIIDNVYCLQQIESIVTYGMRISSIHSACTKNIIKFDKSFSEITFFEKRLNEFFENNLVLLGYNSSISYEPNSPISKMVLNSFIFEEAIRAFNRTGELGGYDISMMVGGYDTPLNYLPNILWEAFLKSSPGPISNKYPISIVEGLEEPKIDDGIIYPIDHILNMLNNPNKDSVIIRIDYVGG